MQHRLRGQMITILSLMSFMALSIFSSPSFSAPTDAGKRKLDLKLKGPTEPTSPTGAPGIKDASKSSGPNWESFQAEMLRLKQSDSVTGISYMVSGGLAVVGGLVGYYGSQDLFAKAVYSISQSVGIAAVGYGSYMYSLGSEQRILFDTIEASRSLSLTQKNDLIQNYYAIQKDRERKGRLIKAITHGLVAAVNAYNATTTTSSDLKTTLYFVSGVNALAAITFVF